MLKRAATTTAADLVNTLFPSDCRLCGGPLHTVSRVPVCGACRARIQPLDAACPYCSRCGDALAPESARFARSLGVSECMACRLAPPAFVRAVAFAAYDHTTRDHLHLLKFGGVAAMASSVLGEGMSSAMGTLQSSIPAGAVVVPVPLFASRARKRGFNQADLLADACLLRLRQRTPTWPLELRRDVLHRVKDTRSSFSMAPHVRRENLRGAFRIGNADAVKGRDVLLVDDILTTGATARECARVLLRAGALNVWVVTYARTLSESAGRESVARWTASSSPQEQVDA